MALDTVILNVGSGGKSIGVDNISSVDYEVVKQAFGVEGDLELVAANNPLPVTDAGQQTDALTDTELRASPVPISGTVTANTGLTQPLTDTQLRATPVPISGTVTAVSATAANLKVAATLDAETTKVIGTINLAAGQTLATVTTVGAVTSITNNVNTVQIAPTTILNGKTTVSTAGSRVVLAGSTTCKSVTIKALSTNAGFIYVGDTSVASTNGFQLLAGDTVSIDIANLNTVNIDSSVNGEGVSYVGVN